MFLYREAHLTTYILDPRMNYSTNAATLPPPATTGECSGCTFVIGVFEISWNTKIYTHTAATVLVEVDKASNKTRTSTVQGTEVLPSAPLYASYVTGSVITTVVGESTYTM